MNKPLPGLMDVSKEMTPLTIIRSETALSRFPVHRIAKKGNVRIELKHHAQALVWRVSYNSEYGQPGPLAYKLDTLIVNRRIEDCGRPVPKFLRLGSLRDIAEEIGTGEKNTNTVKLALLQNASAFINAKLSYRTKDRSERTLEAAFTRYSIVFTGESLPNGKTADAVYLVLNDVYMEVLNAAVTRPLDYDYMKALPPAAQRFYEIVSYQIYAALLHQNERARLRYSEYCMLSTATRYLDFDHVKKQMYKVHRSHLDSGYLAKIGYEETLDEDGQPDWWMYYVPGPNASREFHEFTGGQMRLRGGGARRAASGKADAAGQEGDADGMLLPFPEFSSSGILAFATAQGEVLPAEPSDEAKFEAAGVVERTETAASTSARTQKSRSNIVPVSAGSPKVPGSSVSPVLPASILNTISEESGAAGELEDLEPSDDRESLVARLVTAGLNRSSAERFAVDAPEECRRQLTYLPFVTSFRSGPGAYLRRAIEQGFGPPADFLKLQEMEQISRKQKAAEVTRAARKAALEARQRAEDEKVDSAIALLETDAPAAFHGFLRFMQQRCDQSLARFASMRETTRARMRATLEEPESRRNFYKEWQALPDTERESFLAASLQATGPEMVTDPGAALDEDPAVVRAIVAASLGEGTRAFGTGPTDTTDTDD